MIARFSVLFCLVFFATGAVAHAMDLGVQTHFAQNWNIALLDKAADLGIRNIRDEQYWAAIEQRPGVYKFPVRFTRYMAVAAAHGIEPLITLSFANPFYDQGFSPYTAAGRKAFADYAIAVLDQYRGQIKAVEIWNEYNGSFASGPATKDRPFYYTEMLKTAYSAIKEKYPEVMVLGASTVLIPLPYIEDLFEHGALDYMDAISIHPYRARPNGVAKEIRALQALMRTYGQAKPIYVTEFGRAFDDPAEAPGYMVKMATLLASAGVERAYWYPFKDHREFRNMGLLDRNGNPFPALAAFQFLQQEILPLGTPVREDIGGQRTHVYRFADDLHVVWGRELPVTFKGRYELLDARGRPLKEVTTLGPDPVVVKGDFRMEPGVSPVLADSVYDFGQPEWSYFACTPDGDLVPLASQTNQWREYLGDSRFPWLSVKAGGMHPSAVGGKPVYAVTRYTAPSAAAVELNGHWAVSTRGDGVDVYIALNGKIIWQHTFTGTASLNGLPLHLEAGDTLDIAVGPNGNLNFDYTSLKVELRRTDLVWPASDAKPPPHRPLSVSTW